MVTGVYVRVSTEEQVREGYSIRAQEEKLRSYAALKNWHVYGIYAEACVIIEPTQEAA